MLNKLPILLVLLSACGSINVESSADAGDVPKDVQAVETSDAGPEARCLDERNLYVVCEAGKGE